MREILFRGKTAEEIFGKEKWMYGDFISESVYGLYPRIKSDDGLEYEVIPKTVGQYTGLADRNGTKIFEGDILRIYSRAEKKVGVFKVKFSPTDLWFGFEPVYSGAIYSINELLERELGDELDFDVIGNIYDNPELLEVK